MYQKGGLSTRLDESLQIQEQQHSIHEEHPKKLSEISVISADKGKRENKNIKPDKSTGKSTKPKENQPSPQDMSTLVAFMNKGRYQEAATLAHMLTARFPKHGFAWGVLGVVLKILGRSMEALTSLQNAVKYSPGDLSAHYNLGVMLHDLGRLDDAETSYRNAIKIKPKFPEAHNNLGNILKELGWLMEAESSYHKALKIKPNYAEAYNNLGNILQEMKRTDEAIANFRSALSIQGDWKEALHRLTTPLVLTKGLLLGSGNGADITDICAQDSTVFEKSTNPNVSVASVTANQEQKIPGDKTSKTVILKKLKIILVYPPPWQIPTQGDTNPGMPFGPPKDRNNNILNDSDFKTMTYGLLTIAAQAKRAGHDVTIYNFSNSSWQDIKTLIAHTEADIFGISAFTANRRGMGAVAALIRQHHPKAHITVGGPFVTALPQHVLKYYKDIDTVVIGEGEDTFMELIEHLLSGLPAVGIPGTAYRKDKEIALGPLRPRIKNLDALASPFDYFTSLIVMTSRGCPNKCSFCGSFITWGKKMCFHSAEFCLEIFNKALSRLNLPFIAIKDDTFTAHRRRVITICDEIVKNKMDFIWSCDSRVDTLDDELLYKMRIAGCQMISLGVESGSPEILKTIRKETTPDMVLNATRSARKYGMYVRYYMIYGNRGETPDTIQQSNQLIKSGKPNRYISSVLSFFPGTEDWEILCEKQELTSDIFFRNDFTELNVATNRQKEMQHVMLHGRVGQRNRPLGRSQNRT